MSRVHGPGAGWCGSRLVADSRPLLIAGFGNVPEGRRKSAAGDEDVFPAVVGERLTRKAAVPRLELQAGDIEQPKPLVLGSPPEGELFAPSSSVMSIRLSPTEYRIVCGTGSSWCSPSKRAATRWSKAQTYLTNERGLQRVTPVATSTRFARFCVAGSHPTAAPWTGIPCGHPTSALSGSPTRRISLVARRS
jgi:hypothetical protein